MPYIGPQGRESAGAGILLILASCNGGATSPCLWSLFALAARTGGVRPSRLIEMA